MPNDILSTEVQEILDTCPIHHRETVEVRLTNFARSLDGDEAEVSARIVDYAKSLVEQAQVEELTERWITRRPRSIQRWNHERRGDSEFIDLTLINQGREFIIAVDATFYDRRMAGGRMEIYVKDGDVFYGDGQRLANIVASEIVPEFYSATAKRSGSLLDFRRASLLIKFTVEQREHCQRLEEENRRNLVGAKGRHTLTDKDVEQHLMATEGGVREINGHRVPYDSYKPRMLQIGGKRVDQAFDINEAPADLLPAKSVRPKGAAPNHGVYADSLPIEADVQKVPTVKLEPPKRRCKPQPLIGANGITRAGDIERTTPPWASQWIEDKQ